MRTGYCENPRTLPIMRERLWRFTDDSSALISLWLPLFHAAGIGWTLHKQGQGYLESGYYRAVEAPLDTCWVLDAIISYGGHGIAFLALTRSRRARQFTVDDVQRLDPLRPWLAHAFRRTSFREEEPEGRDLSSAAGAPVMSGEMILTPDREIVFQTNGLEFVLRRVLEGETGDYRAMSPSARIPAPIVNLLQRIIGAANGSLCAPPRMQFSTICRSRSEMAGAEGCNSRRCRQGSKGCLIAVTIELREHAIAHAARVLRESGATATQVKVGIQLALGKTKPAIADELGIKPSSVADQTKRLYQALDIHNSTELATKIWLGGTPSDLHQTRPPSLGYRDRHGLAS
jgi:DNA-binding CsgD family transcriptional regulator